MDSNAVIDRTIAAAMDLCAERGWRVLRLSQIAERAEITPEQLSEHFASKDDILDALFDGFDTSLALADDMAGETVRDKLFAMMMERLDLASPYRSALMRMRDEGIPARVLCRSKQWLEQLVIKSDISSLWRPLHGVALGVIWVMVLPTWFDDDSADLSKTMAALDTQLGNAEQLWQGISGWWQRRVPQEPL